MTCFPSLVDVRISGILILVGLTCSSSSLSKTLASSCKILLPTLQLHQPKKRYVCVMCEETGRHTSQGMTHIIAYITVLPHLYTKPPPPLIFGVMVIVASSLSTLKLISTADMRVVDPLEPGTSIPSSITYRFPSIWLWRSMICVHVYILWFRINSTEGWGYFPMIPYDHTHLVLISSSPKLRIHTCKVVASRDWAWSWNHPVERRGWNASIINIRSSYMLIIIDVTISIEISISTLALDLYRLFF